MAMRAFFSVLGGRKGFFAVFAVGDGFQDDDIELAVLYELVFLFSPFEAVSEVIRNDRGYFTDFHGESDDLMDVVFFCQLL